MPDEGNYSIQYYLRYDFTTHCFSMLVSSLISTILPTCTDSEDEWLTDIVLWAQRAKIDRDDYKMLRYLMEKRSATVQLPSIHRLTTKRLERMIQARKKFRFIHCCSNNCIAYTGRHAREKECPRCGQTKYVQVKGTRTRRPRKTFGWFYLFLNLWLWI